MSAGFQKAGFQRAGFQVGTWGLIWGAVSRRWRFTVAELSWAIMAAGRAWTPVPAERAWKSEDMDEGRWRQTPEAGWEETPWK